MTEIATIMLGFALPTGMGEVEEFMAVTVHNGITVIITIIGSIFSLREQLDHRQYRDHDSTQT